MKRKKPLRATVGLARSTLRSKPRAKRRSPERENGRREWQKIRGWVLDRARHLCEARIDGVCRRRAEHVHHRKLRSQGGSDDPGNLLAVCFACHEHIHHHPAWSYERGFLVRRDDDSGEYLAG